MFYYKKYLTSFLRNELLTYHGRMTNLGRQTTIIDILRCTDIQEQGYHSRRARLANYAWTCNYICASRQC